MQARSTARSLATVKLFRDESATKNEKKKEEEFCHLTFEDNFSSYTVQNIPICTLKLTLNLTCILFMGKLLLFLSASEIVSSIL